MMERVGGANLFGDGFVNLTALWVFFFLSVLDLFHDDYSLLSRDCFCYNLLGHNLLG